MSNRLERDAERKAQLTIDAGYDKGDGEPDECGAIDNESEPPEPEIDYKEE